MEKIDYIEGYKAFNSDFTALNNIKFKVGDHKHIDGIVKAGPIGGHGFHLCKNFEDTFRFVEENPILCEVIGFGKISNEYIDYYNGYDEIYACSDIIIKRIVSREEIIQMAKNLSGYKLERLIITYKMTNEEIKEIENNLSPQNNKKRIKKFIDYYHNNNKDAFK